MFGSSSVVSNSTTYNLTVSTEYDVEVTVHNASRDKPADGTAVDIHWIEFGAGGQIKHPITITADERPGMAGHLRGHDQMEDARYAGPLLHRGRAQPPQ